MWIFVPIGILHFIVAVVSFGIAMGESKSETTKMFLGVFLYCALIFSMCIAAAKAEGGRIMYEKVLEERGLLIRFTDVDGSQVLRWSETLAEKGDVK